MHWEGGWRGAFGHLTEQQTAFSQGQQPSPLPENVLLQQVAPAGHDVANPGGALQVLGHWPGSLTLPTDNRVAATTVIAARAIDVMMSIAKLPVELTQQ